ncbi:MAG: glycosyltransferase [Bacteroidota bacterium]
MNRTRIFRPLPLQTIHIGNYNNTKFGKYAKQKFGNSKKIEFLGGVYNLEHLNNLRYYSKIYFHGHSVGGTNPSLLEAMASNTLIVAHDNPFNKSILQKNAFYFQNSTDVKEHLESLDKSNYQEFVKTNFDEVKEKYNWGIINRKYLSFCQQSLDRFWEKRK